MIEKKYIEKLYDDFLIWKTKIIYEDSVCYLVFYDDSRSKLSQELKEYKDLLLKYMVK